LLAFAGGTPANAGSTTSIYLQAQKVVWRPDASKPQGLTLFGSAQFATSGHPFVQSFFQLGAVLHGTFPGRPNDVFAVDFQHNLFNHRTSGRVNDLIAAQGLSGTIANSEQILEVNYSLELAPGIRAKPYTAYFFHPDQNLFNVAPNPKITYAWAVGVQFSVLFNTAFGLPGFFRPN
jgi:porin